MLLPPPPHPICFSLLLFAFHLLQLSKQVLCGPKEGKHTVQSSPSQNGFCHAKWRKWIHRDLSFSLGCQQGWVPRGKNILTLVICHACHWSSQTLALLLRTFPTHIDLCLPSLWTAITQSYGQEPKDSHEDNFPDVWASSKFEGKSNQKNLTVSAGKAWCILTTAYN